MAEITFVVDPGVDDIAIDGVSLNEITAFRVECLTGGAVSCDWGTLHERLINHDVSRFWWFLSELERRSITEMAVKNTMFFEIHKTRSGKSNCGGGEGEWTGIPAIECGYNALIKYLKFNNSLFTGVDSCYWCENENDVCYRPDNSYGLPCYIAFCGTAVGYTGSEYGHYLCAMQVSDAVYSLDGWILFQYTDFDIKPPHWQIPTDSHDLYLKIYSLDKFTGCGSAIWSDEIITRFDL